MISKFFPIWNQLTVAQQERLSADAQRLSVEAGAQLHNGSADCTGLLLVECGQLRAYMLSPDGREITLYRLLDGDICLLSASCMMKSIRFDIFIEAVKPSDYWLIPADAYQRMMAESAIIANFTNELMANRFSEVMWLMEQILWQSFDKRLAAFLLEEATLENSDRLKLTHETIGNYLGHPREVVTRMLRYFQSESMVALARGSVTIVDREALKKLSDR